MFRVTALAVFLLRRSLSSAHWMRVRVQIVNELQMKIGIGIASSQLFAKEIDVADMGFRR